uniref:RNase H type-1 domain-containing protein n=1 Tax=viral metagenome TaxID=1070528 RepID=A0A6C0JVL4_9ZZZZ
MRPAVLTFLRGPKEFTALSHLAKRPPSLAFIQTDGSFSRGNISRTAVTLNTKDNINYTLLNTYFDHKNSGESEWCSILDGLLYAQKKDQGSVELENDCLPVIRHLILRKPPMKGYLTEYYSAILKEVKIMDYIAVRWIPREMNGADKLFRID